MLGGQDSNLPDRLKYFKGYMQSKEEEFEAGIGQYAEENTHRSAMEFFCEKMLDCLKLNLENKGLASARTPGPATGKTHSSLRCLHVSGNC